MKINNKKESLAITQILILLIGIVAIGYAIGSSVGVVSAQAPEPGHTPISTETEVVVSETEAQKTYEEGIIAKYNLDGVEGEVEIPDEAIVRDSEGNVDKEKTDKNVIDIVLEGAGLLTATDTIIKYGTKGAEAIGIIEKPVELASTAALETGGAAVEGAGQTIGAGGGGWTGSFNSVPTGGATIAEGGATIGKGGVTLGKGGAVVGKGGAVAGEGGVWGVDGAFYPEGTQIAQNTALETGALESGTLESGELASGTVAEGGSALGTFATVAAGAAAGAFLVWGFYKWIVEADVRNMRDIANAAIVGAVVAIGVTYALAAAGGFTLITLGTVASAAAISGPVGWVAFVVAVIVVALITLFTFKNYSQETYTYLVTAWKAQDGGDNCDKCNDLRYGCTEYQCKSFGKACAIENAGTTQEICVWKNPDDIFAPEINAIEKFLPSPSADYSYKPLQAVQGVKIDYSKDPSGNGCIPPYTALTLAVETNEFAQCKIDVDRTPNFDDMAAPMPKVEGFAEEHVLDLPHIAAPSVESQLAVGILEADITNGQSQEFYIRCEDVNGNSNFEEFIMEFCVQDGPDTFAPIILGTNFLNYLQYNQTDTDLEIYTNEPAECKWSPEDLSYDSMQFGMTNCSFSEGDYAFSGFQYGCRGTLTGLKDRVENKAYIKCKDKPWWTSSDQGQRYANEEPFILTLQGTEPLFIDEITVNGKLSGATIKDSTNTIKATLGVTASAGAEQGKSICQYESGGAFVDFNNEGNPGFVSKNTQSLYLGEGNYNVSIKCFDIAGNGDEGSIEFTIDTDREAPLVVRAYYDVNNLRIITDEPAECVYTNQANIACNYNFDDGTPMTVIDETKHHVSWETNNKYYIKCKDIFGNQALPNQCSILVNAFGGS